MLRRCGGQLCFGHHAWQRRRLRQAEEDKERPLDQRDEIDLRHRQRIQRIGERDAPQRQRAPDITQHHRAPAIPAIDERPSGQPQHQIGERPQRPSQSGLGGRMRKTENEQRESQLRRIAADR